MRPAYIFIFAFSLALLGGCSGMFGSSEPGEPYFYGEFDDIPIPSELSGAKETTIITAPGGVKTGVQVFKGRVEVGSLNSAMLGYMQREGWQLRSSTRGGRSLLLFEKDDRYATIYILESLFSTEMQVYVSPKLTNTNAARPRATSGAKSTQGAQGAGSSSSAPANSFDSQYINE